MRSMAQVVNIMELKGKMCHSKENLGLNDTSEKPTSSIGTKSLVPLPIANDCK
jgi:hypothetical protein